MWPGGAALNIGKSFPAIRAAHAMILSQEGGPSLSAAGRVQSVALRLISEREAEIEVFQPKEYWSIEAELSTPGGAKLDASVAEACSVHGWKTTLCRIWCKQVSCLPPSEGSGVQARA